MRTFDLIKMSILSLKCKLIAKLFTRMFFFFFFNSSSLQFYFLKKQSQKTWGVKTFALETKSVVFKIITIINHVQHPHWHSLHCDITKKNPNPSTALKLSAKFFTPHVFFLLLLFLNWKKMKIVLHFYNWSTTMKKSQDGNKETWPYPGAKQ